MQQQQLQNYEEDGDDHANGRCDYDSDREAYYDKRRSRTLCGRRPIGKPSAWICPMRPSAALPVGSVDDNAAERYYCPRCDWCEYYCLCDVEHDRETLERLEKRRARETGFVGFGGAMRFAVEQATKEIIKKNNKKERRNDDDRTETTGRSERLLGTSGRIAVESGIVAVDERSQQSHGPSLVGTQSMDETSSRSSTGGSDVSRSSVGRSNDVLLTAAATTVTTTTAGVNTSPTKRQRRKQILSEREDFSLWTDEELLRLGRALDVGDVQICCSWTAGTEADEEDLAKNPDRWTKRCCVWVRRGEQSEPEQQQPTSTSSTTSTTRTTTKRPKPDWKTPGVNGIVYGRSEIAKMPRTSRRLTADEERSWRERAQMAIDLEQLNETLRLAEEELEARRRRTLEFEQEWKRWDEDWKRNKQKQQRKKRSFRVTTTNVNDLRNRRAISERFKPYIRGRRKKIAVATKTSAKSDD